MKRYDVPGRAIASVFCSDFGFGIPYVSLAGKLLVVPGGSLDRPLAETPARVQNIFRGKGANWYETAAASERHDVMLD